MIISTSYSIKDKKQASIEFLLAAVRKDKEVHWEPRIHKKSILELIYFC